MSQKIKLIFGIIFFLTIVFSCQQKPKQLEAFEKGTYGYDLLVLKKHTKSFELRNGDARILVSQEYQGRVMTSTSEGESGLSYGWINHDLIASGETLKQINPVGGEERFWLGPEGGQFSIFFENGSNFDFADWRTPSAIDTETYELVNSNDTLVEFKKSVRLKNYSNFLFEFEVNRKIKLLNRQALQNELEIDLSDNVKSVAYTTINQLHNTGEKSWSKETGLLSIWLLGMFNPSDEVTIFIPYKTEVVSDYIVKNDYFGKIADDRLVVKNGFVFLKGDGKQRGKIGIPPQRALPVLGSYDAANQILTIVKCEIPENETDYVNSAWEMQEFPFKGDAINAYNDGPLEDGGQMGPFYELETSSPALALQVGSTATYSQSTVHFQGTEEELNSICQQIFNISLAEIKSVF